MNEVASPHTRGVPARHHELVAGPAAVVQFRPGIVHADVYMGGSTPPDRIRRNQEALAGEVDVGRCAGKTRGVNWTYTTGRRIWDNPHENRAFEIHGVVSTKWHSLGSIAIGLAITVVALVLMCPSLRCQAVMAS